MVVLRGEPASAARNGRRSLPPGRAGPAVGRRPLRSGSGSVARRVLLGAWARPVGGRKRSWPPHAPLVTRLPSAPGRARLVAGCFPTLGRRPISRVPGDGNFSGGCARHGPITGPHPARHCRRGALAPRVRRSTGRYPRSVKQLGGLDTMFLYGETPAMHMHVCGLLILDTSTMPGGYNFETIRQTLVDRMPSIPATRQLLARVPLGVSRPFWVDDPHLDVDRHLHREAVPSPGDDRALATLVGDIASWPLHRDRPLWEMWVVEGLEAPHVAMVAKMHHSTIDGISGANLMAHLLDLEPSGEQSREEQVEHQPIPPPNLLTLFGLGLASRLAQPWEQIGRAHV